MLFDRTFVSHALLGLVLCVKFLMSNQIQIAEAAVYVGLGLTIAGYWAFSAWLKLKEKQPAERGETEQLKKDFAEIKTKMNAILIKSGFGV